jgi:hypothetical protein
VAVGQGLIAELIVVRQRRANKSQLPAAVNQLLAAVKKIINSKPVILSGVRR